MIPGNHDSKNVGYLHFRDTFGAGDVPAKGDRVVRVHGGDPAMTAQLVAIDSSKPDLAEGEVGRERYEWIRDQLSDAADLKIFALHHHLVPVPGTGRERNTVWDAGDVLALVADAGVRSGAVGPQARAACVVGQRRADRELGDGFVSPGAGLHAAVVQHHRGHARADAGDDEVPGPGRTAGR